MAEGVILIVDLGHENSQMIKEDVESFGIKAEICPHNLMSEEEVMAYGDVKGFILNGGPHKKERGFRIVAYPIFAEMKWIPAYSVDYSFTHGVDLYTWPEDQEERRVKIGRFLEKKCKVL